LTQKCLSYVVVTAPWFFSKILRGLFFSSLFKFLTMSPLALFSIDELLETKKAVELLEVSYEPDRQDLKSSILYKITTELEVRRQQRFVDDVQRPVIVVGEGKYQTWIF
jgi:hypothetical protein